MKNLKSKKQSIYNQFTYSRYMKEIENQKLERDVKYKKDQP